MIGGPRSASKVVMELSMEGSTNGEKLRKITFHSVQQESSSRQSCAQESGRNLLPGYPGGGGGGSGRTGKL
jgi:hypothetical protein